MDFNLTEKLYDIREKGKYPMHMPGHKRSEKMNEFGNELSIPYEFDITEIEGYDNLHAPNGILSLLAEGAADLYRARKAYPLINGSTAGILAAIGACTQRNKSIIVQRSSHKSVYNAIELFSLEPTYVYPSVCEELGIFGSVKAADVEKAFKESPDAAAVVITSPTYEGVISNIEEIAGVVHSHGAYLIVDCAHGAHLGFCVNEYFPDALIRYSDIAVVSLHKTLPALTQTALLLNFTDSAELDGAIRRMLGVFMTSSPSYILLSSIDKCLSIMKKHGRELFSEYTEALEGFQKKISSLQNIFVLGYGNSHTPKDVFAFDKGKLNVFCRDLVDVAENRVTADVLAKFLRLNGFEPEMVSANYLILMTSIMDDPEKLLKVGELLCNFDEWCRKADGNSLPIVYPTPTIKMTLHDAVMYEFDLLGLEECEGRISLDYVMCYPPGIPVVCPGEEISREIIDFIGVMKNSDVNVIGGDIVRVKK